MKWMSDTNTANRKGAYLQGMLTMKEIKTELAIYLQTLEKFKFIQYKASIFLAFYSRKIKMQSN